MAKKRDSNDKTHRSSIRGKHKRTHDGAKAAISKYPVRFAVTIRRQDEIETEALVAKGDSSSRATFGLKYDVSSMFQSGQLSEAEMLLITRELLARSPHGLDRDASYVVMKVGMRAMPELPGLSREHLRPDDVLLTSAGLDRPGLISAIFQSQFDGEFQLRSFDDHASAERECRRFVQTQLIQRTMELGETRIDALKKGLSSALKGLRRDDYAGNRALLANISDVTREAIAQAFESILTEKAKSLPQQDYDRKKIVARFVNSELRRFGLAIRCPKTGAPAFLVAHPGGRPGIGRYHFEVTESGKPHRTVTTSDFPESLKLMPDQIQAGAGIDGQPRRSR